MLPSSTPPQSLVRLRLVLALVVAALATVGVLVAASGAAQPEAGTYAQVAWGNAASQQFTNSEAQGVAVGGRLYAFGGFDSQKACCTPTSRAYRFDPAVDAWTALTPVPGVNGRPGGMTHAGIATDGQYVFLAGGYVANSTGTGQVFGTREVWRFDPAANGGLGSYTRIADLPVERAGGQLAVVGTNLHFFGGTDLARTTDTAEHWALPLSSARSTGGTWAARASMAKGRHHMGSAVVGGRLYAIGGQRGHDAQLVTQPDVDVYDPATDTWSTSRPTCRRSPARPARAAATSRARPSCRTGGSSSSAASRPTRPSRARSSPTARRQRVVEAHRDARAAPLRRRRRPRRAAVPRDRRHGGHVPRGAGPVRRLRRRLRAELRPGQGEPAAAASTSPAPRAACTTPRARTSG
jgi:N-acetylneuraminic acid mutarotase